MNITKEQLSFLSIFEHIKDKTGKLSDKIHISLKDGIVRFTQLSGGLKAIKEIDVSDQRGLEDFEFLYETQNFIQLVKSSDKVNISKDGISFGGKSKYNFESLDITYPDIVDFLDLKNSKPEEEFEVKDLEMAYFCSDFCGEDKFAFVALQSDNFASSDYQSVACISASSNKFDYEKDDDGDEKSKIFIPIKILSLFSKYRLSSIQVKTFNEKGFWTFELDGTLCIVPIETCLLPNIVKGTLSSSYNHKEFVKFSKSSLFSVAKRMKIMDERKDSRVKFKITKTELEIENSKSNRSSDSIDVELSSDSIITDDNDKRSRIIVSSDAIQRILTALDGESIFMYVSDDLNNFSTVRFEDENHLIKIVHILFEEGT